MEETPPFFRRRRFLSFVFLSAANEAMPHNTRLNLSLHTPIALSTPLSIRRGGGGEAFLSSFIEVE